MEGLIEDKRLLVLDLIDMSFLARNEIIVPVVSNCHCTCETVHTTHGSQSRKYGDEAVRAFKQGQQTLRKAMNDDSVEERLERIEKSLDSLFDGLIKQRQQIGAGVAVNVAGHMLAAKARKKR